MQSKFSNKTICLDLKNSTPYKEKKKLIEILTSNGAKVSFILKKGVSLLIKNDKNDFNTYKCQNAFKYGIPVIHSDFINIFLTNQTANIREFLLKNEENKENFKKGRLVKSIYKKQNNFCNLNLNFKGEIIKKISKSIDLKKIKIYTSESADIPSFNEDFIKVIKWSVFQVKYKRKKNNPHNLKTIILFQEYFNNKRRHI